MIVATANTTEMPLTVLFGNRAQTTLSLTLSTGFASLFPSARYGQPKGRLETQAAGEPGFLGAP